jgi:hypothetical protein
MTKLSLCQISSYEPILWLNVSGACGSLMFVVLEFCQASAISALLLLSMSDSSQFSSAMNEITVHLHIQSG